MKKIMTFALAVLCLVSVLAGCSGKTEAAPADTAAVEKELTSAAWVGTFENNTVTWKFNGGKVSVENVYNNESYAPDTGSYKVNGDGTIVLTWDVKDNNRVETLYFTFQNNTLKLFGDKEKEVVLNKQ